MKQAFIVNACLLLSSGALAKEDALGGGSADARMLKAVADYANENGIPCEVSLEERMACGVGICYGCACRPKKLEKGMLRVCKEGPVFELGVIYNEFKS